MPRSISWYHSHFVHNYTTFLATNINPHQIHHFLSKKIINKKHKKIFKTLTASHIAANHCCLHHPTTSQPAPTTIKLATNCQPNPNPTRSQHRLPPLWKSFKPTRAPPTIAAKSPIFSRRLSPLSTFPRAVDHIATTTIRIQPRTTTIAIKPTSSTTYHCCLATLLLSTTAPKESSSYVDQNQPPSTLKCRP